MANLIIDIGNTFCKVAVFDNQELTHHFQVKELTPEHLFEQVNFLKISFCLVSSTRKKPENLILAISKKTKCTWLDFNLNLPFNNKYATPKTLGKDRIALTSAACKEFPNSNTLIVDAGTCITYDFINTNSEYLGGAISPGIQMRFSALNQFTHGLPLVDSRTFDDIVGDSTENNITSGVLNGVFNEVDGVINQYHQRFANLNVVLTGGDQVFFVECLKNNFFARPDFLLAGLNYIADLNA